MKTFFKWFALAAGILFLLVYFAFLFILPNAVDINKFKPELQKLAKDYAKLDINFENAKIVTTPLLAAGLRADSVSVKLPDGSLLAGMDSFSARVSLPHLLILCVKVPAAEINSPVINLEIKDGEQFKIVSLVESILNAGDDAIEQKLLKSETNAESKTSAACLPIRINVPKVVINNYAVKIDDLKSKHMLVVKGDRLTAAYNGKSFKVRTKTELLSDENKNITADINLNCFIPPVSQLDKEDDPQEIIDIPFVNPVLIYRDYDLKADINMDMKIKQRGDLILTKGFFNVDGLTMNLSGVQLPESYAHIISGGTRVNLDTNIAVKEGEAINIQGLVRYGKNALADLIIKSDKIYFNDVITLAKAFLDTLKIKNDLNLFAGRGYILADTRFKTNFKSLKSAGEVIIRDAGIVNKLYNLDFMDFNSTLDLNNDMLVIKDTGAMINGSKIQIEGSINEKSIADIKVYLEQLPLVPLFNSFAPAEIKKTIGITSGELFADIKLEGALKNAVSTIKFGLKNFAMNEKSSGIKLANELFEGDFASDLKNMTGTLVNNKFKVIIPQSTSSIVNDNLKINIGAKDITILPSVLKINETSNITLSGKVENYLSKPNIDITANGSLDTLGIRQLGGQAAEPFIDAKGSIPVSLKIYGNAKKQTVDFITEADAENYLTPVHITRLAGKNTAIKSTINLKNDRIKIKDTGLYIKTVTPDEKHPDKLITNYEEIAGITGTISGLNSVPHINILKIKTDGELPGDIQGLDNSSFTLGGHLFTYGNLMSPRFKGGFNIKDVNLPSLYITLKNLALDFKGETMDVKLADLNLNGSNMQITSNISLQPSSDIVINNLSAASNYVDADKIMQVSEAAMKLTENIGNAEASSSVQAADIPVEIRNGSIDIKRAKSGGIIADNITAKLLMKNNVFFVNKLKTNAFDGQLLGDISMNLVTTLLRASITGSGFDVEKSLSALANMKDTLTGTASVDIDVSLKGSTYEEQMKTLNGEVDFCIVSGQLGPFGKLENLILAENIRESQFFQTAVGGIISNLLSINTSHFDELTGHIILKDGVAQIDPITSLGEIMCINITGDFDILQNTTDLRLRGRLASTVSDMLGPIAMLNPINMVKTSTGSSVMSVATLGLYTLFCETVTQEEMDAVPAFSSDASDYNSTKFQVKIRGDVAKPFTLVKSFKWMALQSAMDEADSYVQQKTLEEEQAQAEAAVEDTGFVKSVLNNFKGLFKKNETNSEIQKPISENTQNSAQ